MHEAPIVLVHGLLGFARIGLGSFGMHYFRGVPEALREAGFVVPDPPALPTTGGITSRATVLAEYLDQPALRGRRVHLIAHSMGGLDSRHYLARLGGAARVLTLTTIGTPHRGSPIADLGVERLPLAIRLLADWGVATEAFHDLTSERCRRFNEKTGNVPGVRYFSIAGTVNPAAVPPSSLWTTYQLIAQGAAKEPANDGLVTVSSATWGEACEVWEGLDHVQLINWGSIVAPQLPFDDDVIARYLAIARRLAALAVD